jgi:hypothetical protein
MATKGAPEQPAYFNSAPVSAFLVLLEEVTRAKPGSPQTRFVVQDASESERLSSRFHHVLFGRRGSGKSSLLRKIQSEKRMQGRPVAWVDQEVLMNLAFPDVLVSTLEQIFSDFAQQIEDGIAPPPDRHWWRRSTPPTAEWLLVGELRIVVSKLAELKSAPDGSDIEWTATSTDSLTATASSGGSLAIAPRPCQGRIQLLTQ